mgnify:CR=1 FL=1
MVTLVDDVDSFFFFNCSALGKINLSKLKNLKFDLVLISSVVNKLTPIVIKEIKKISKTHKDELKNFPRELSNYHILDGANETVRIGRMKFHGSNMFTEDMAIYADKYKTKEIPDEDYFVMVLYEFQKIFAEIKAVINKYCPDRNIWTGFNGKEEK